MFVEEANRMLNDKILPFWENLKDDTYGGFYGWLDFELNLDKKAVKGCILNSRILWFFSNAYLTLKDTELLPYAKHAYEFLKKYCIDKEYGGVYWSLNYDGTVFDSTKHTYNQAFAIYALASYYDATKEEEALKIAYDLYRIIESNCTDEVGYLEAFTYDFKPEDNDKLSENGVIAEKTMNTLLHVFEAYTELYRVTKDEQVAKKLYFIMDVFEKQVFNEELRRQEVFFDKNMNSILDLHSYGHDIETAWLIDRGCEVLNDAELTKRMHRITSILEDEIYKVAYVDHSLLNECEKGNVNRMRVWWVQAEAVVGFFNAYEKSNDERYKEAAKDILEYIKTKLEDQREGSEWYWQLDDNHLPDTSKPIVEPWKCPYHNGRMCFEIIRRNIDVA
ncbi:mannobiose 2-epimerase [Anaerosporobacter mobilis DSM 15930]|jgi:mannobiose 2-epimerase|uniref:Cellobiose 2-epimerase n=1 Tax=Anaerosporobacter mobilis DSM 15930 TaxID=1120996 RepID=A0A1M7FCG9_9FIRM|nr:AGE family epimerase/isomerase [Anaerosporobacter mobilis]SHM01696.1 mannobiose 2-epimerase [Anaerosporobacter mobilis DSM 15930]